MILRTAPLNRRLFLLAAVGYAAVAASAAALIAVVGLWIAGATDMDVAWAPTWDMRLALEPLNRFQGYLLNTVEQGLDLGQRGSPLGQEGIAHRSRRSRRSEPVPGCSSKSPEASTRV